MSRIDDDIFQTIFSEIDRSYDVRRGSIVPSTTTVTQTQAVSIDATYLYADLAESSWLAQRTDPLDASRIIRAYVGMAVRLIRYQDGHIRSFDGDRVMGVFIGSDKESRAGRTALALNAYMSTLTYLANKKLRSIAGLEWQARHGVGIDTGRAHLVRAGIRNSADLVSIGSAPNVAAKLSDIRDEHAIHATERAYAPMSWDVSFKGSPRDVLNAECMWSDRETIQVGGQSYDVRGSQWTWPYPST